MKRKFLMSFLAVVCALCCVLGFAACANKSTDKTDQFIRVSDGVFASAGYTNSSSNNKKTSALALAKAIAVDSRSAESGISAEINELYTAVKTDSNTGILDEYNFNYIKGDTLYQGANLAAMFRAMASVLGDEVFSSVYDLEKLGMPDSVAKLVEDDYYTLYAVMRDGSTITSAVQIDFKEYSTGKFMFKLAQYSKMNGVSELHFSYYDSESVAFLATLHGDINEDFNTYDEKYASYTATDYTIAIFDGEDYVSGRSSRKQQDETILKFVKDSLGFNNQTYKTLADLRGGKSISNKDANGIGSLMNENRYINPYTGTNDKVPVSDEYTIPSDVTVVATASIPATRKLIVPAHVVKILDSPFKYPQYVEEIVFEEPDNGALIQIGDDDIVHDLGTWTSRVNTSRNFLISYTQIKNFTLPKTVKKIAGPIYITTEMEVLDLSAYHPDYELNEDKSGKEDYTVSLYTPYYNRTYGFFKELGSVNKLYANEEFILHFYGSDRFDPEHGIKDGGEEYSTYNEEEDKHYTYSPSVELYQMMEGIFGDHSEETARRFAQYRGYTKTEYFVQELIMTRLGKSFDIDSDLFGKLSLTIDVEDFADMYDLLSGSESGKDFSITLLENGQPKTVLKLFEQGTERTEENWFETVSGESKDITELEFGEIFLAPYALEDSMFVDGVKHYFAGWSFRSDGSSIDAFRGDKVINFFQNMYAVYLPASDGIEFVENDEGNYTARIDGVYTDILVIPDRYGTKQVTALELVSYDCRKIIMSGIGTANSEIIRAIANNQLQSFQSVVRLSDDGAWDVARTVTEKLKTCNGVYEEDGLYYIRNYSSYYFMLFAADEDLTGSVYIPNDCYIMAVEFGAGVNNIYMPNSSALHTIDYLKFNTISNLTIPTSVTNIGEIEGTVTKHLSIMGSGNKLAITDLGFYNVHVDGVQIFMDTYVEVEGIWGFFNPKTKLYMECGIKDIKDKWNTPFIPDNVYFYSPEEPDFDDPDYGGYQYWHFNSNYDFAVWENLN